MTNAEKYLKDGVEQRYFATDLYEFIKNVKEPNLLSLINTFLSLPVKPILSEDEKVILKSIPHLKSVSRSIENDICVHYQQKQKYGIWGETIVGFNYLFKFIQPRRRI